jgi:hypothetical protein
LKYGHVPVATSLLEERYLDFFNNEEKWALFEEVKIFIRR